MSAEAPGVELVPLTEEAVAAWIGEVPDTPFPTTAVDTGIHEISSTGGTTGVPKGVPMTHAGVNFIPDRLGEIFPVRLTERSPRPVYLASSPLSHAAGRWNPETPRPMRLFRRPEPLEFVSALHPDDPPSQFRWRKRLHRILRAEGPERIGGEWWRIRNIDDVSIHQVRDYYRVEDQDGTRFWVYREGLENDGHARWFVHGLFG